MEGLAEHDGEKLEKAVDNFAEKYLINNKNLISKLYDDLWIIGAKIPDNKHKKYPVKRMCDCFYDILKSPDYDFLESPRSNRDKLVKLFLLSHPFKQVIQYGVRNEKSIAEEEKKVKNNFNYRIKIWASDLSYIEFCCARYGGRQKKEFSDEPYKTIDNFFIKAIDHMSIARVEGIDKYFSSRIIAESYLNLGNFKKAIYNYKMALRNAVKFKKKSIQNLDVGMKRVIENPYRIRKASVEELDMFLNFYNDEFVEFCENHKCGGVEYSLLREIDSFKDETYCTNIISDIIDKKEKGHYRNRKKQNQKFKRQK